MRRSGTQPTVSIIVPTRNNAPSLALTLRSVLTQSVRCRYELLVIDNGSTDESRSVAHDALSAYPSKVRYIYEPVPGLLSGRHRGAAEARSELLMFIDDDIDVAPSWLESIVESFEEPSVQIVGGPSLPKFGSVPPNWVSSFWTHTPYEGRMCNWLSLLDLGQRQRDSGQNIDVDPTYLWGLNFGIRKQALFDLGGFHPDGYPAELLWFRGDGENGVGLGARNAKFRALYNYKALVYHRIPGTRLTPGYFAQRAYCQGISDSYTEFRRNAGISGSDESNQIHFHSGIMPWLRGKARPLKALANELMLTRRGEKPDRPAQGAFKQPANDVIFVKAAIGQAYRLGFEFHQRSVQKHREIFDWVLRRDYWDYRPPAIDGYDRNAIY